jgi:hypothetical protein
MKKNYSRISSLLLITGLFLVFSCKKPEIAELGPPTDFLKVVTGIWKTVKVTQVDEIAKAKFQEPVSRDRTDDMNFTDYTITFNSEGGIPSSFIIDAGNAPNFVDSTGTWKFDNNEYPTEILLTKTGATGPTSTFKLIGPPRDGLDLRIKFERYSNSNLIISYEYILQKL